MSHLFFENDNIINPRAKDGDIEEIKRILALYEAVSGQKVNLEKSTIIFSPNVEPRCKNILGLTVMQSHDKYLGFPTIVGHNKKVDLLGD